jgi:uncharacterized membrane protein SirB2
MDGYFLWCPANKIGGKKWRQNNIGSNGWEETSLSPLLLMIKVTYIIFKNKQWRNRPHKSGLLMICIVFYCNIKITSKTVVPLTGEEYSLHYVV